MSQWPCVLELDHTRMITAGSEVALCNAIRNGADLRIYTEFRHNEHIDVTSDNPARIQEVSEFRVTCLLEDRWWVCPEFCVKGISHDPGTRSSYMITN